MAFLILTYLCCLHVFERAAGELAGRLDGWTDLFGRGVVTTSSRTEKTTEIPLIFSWYHVGADQLAAGETALLPCRELIHPVKSNCMAGEVALL